MARGHHPERRSQIDKRADTHVSPAMEKGEPGPWKRGPG